MKTERWQQINDLFQSAAERAPDERAAFLDEACHGDERLCHDVKLLIASYERTENFIEAPAFEEAPELLTNDRAGALVGELVGHYRIESLIGVGGMGEVYLARDELLGRKVALKFLPQSLTEDEAQLNRLEHEARTASALNHPNILTVHEIGVDGRRHFIATEFIEGETLRAVLTRGKLDLRDALNIAIQVGSALAAAHKSGVLHRDIKPENIMLRPDGYVKVLDFGIAKRAEQKEPASHAEGPQSAPGQTQSGLVVGTAHYMSPEQARGQTVDARTDIWSFGVVLFEMLSGRPPFEGKTPSECIAAVLKREPPLAALKAQQVPARVEQIVRTALHKDKEERYQSVEEMLADLRRLKEVSESVTSGWKRQRKITAFLAASVAVALVVAGLFIYLRPTRTVTNTLSGNASPLASAIPQKSIAVLPFENLSRDPDNAFFTDGVQDEILMLLAKIADLKVISRTSVMQYKSGVGRNLREISQQLGVAHLLEGSVQRAANRVRVNAQLIDARTNAHLWAQTYDRDLADVFAIQSEIAKAIADQLQAQLSPAEKTAIEKPPTTDLAAFDLYTRGKTQLLTTAFTITSAQNFEHAVELLNRAVTRDPVFVEAYYQLAYAHGRLYSLGLDHTAGRLASAEAALQAAIRLRADAGETHLARAQYLYYCRRDYANALAELENARRSLPNDPRILELTGYILRRRGQQEEGLRNLEKAIELDPRNYHIMEQIALSYRFLRRYPEEAAILDRALTISPKDAARKVQRALVDFYWKADTKPLHQAIGSILAEDSGAISQVADSWFICALAEHDHVAAERALVALVDNRWWADAAVILSRSFAEGLLARVMKDEATARDAFSKARAEQEKIVQAQPDYAPALCVLGLIDAALGRKEAALEEARRAVDLLPVEKDSVNGSRMLVYFAIVAGWAGEKDLALQQLELAVRAPNPSSALNYGALKLLPFWDPLRGDPRFEKLVEEAKRPVGGEHLMKIPHDKSIAVLAFENLSNDPDNAYFADGIQEEILTRLSKISDLKVVSRTSTQRFKSAPNNLPQIARQLGVSHILEGAVQKAGDQVRVTVQLIKAENDSHLWGEKYDRKLTDIFAVETEIAANIASVLGAKLSGIEQHAIASRPTGNPKAHQLYLKGRYYWNKRSEQGVKKAIEYFNQAIDADPRYALAYAGVADCYGLLGFHGWGVMPPAEAFPKAKAAAEKALQVDPKLAEPHASLAWAKQNYDWDLESAEREYKLAIGLNPNYATAHQWYGVHLAITGRYSQAIAEIKEAQQIDPVSLIINTNVAWVFYFARRYDEMIAQCEKTLDLDSNFAPSHWILGQGYRQKGMYEEAITEFQKAVHLSGGDPVQMAALGHAYAVAGKRADAEKIINALKEISGRRYFPPYFIALIYVGLGDKNQAFEWLGKALAERSAVLVFLTAEPMFDAIRDDPRFEQIIDSLPPNAVVKSALDKSVAVLPFDNLSRDPDNAFFADGVQDEILTNLSRVAHLKVISRTSVMQHKSGVARNLREIGQQLGVGHVVEGSVQRSGNRVRINAQLVDARSDRHLWAQTYDRDLADVFAIQSEIAEHIVSQLRSKLSPQEKEAIEEKPTADLAAHDLYTRAKILIAASHYSTPRVEILLQAVHLLNQAIERDPAFALAYYQLAHAHDQLYFGGIDHTPARLALADAAIQSLARLRPNSGEAHLAHAKHLYWGYLDYDHAREELSLAQKSLPNEPWAFVLGGFIDRRQGRWTESIKNLEHAIELDPQNGGFLGQLAFSYSSLRRYADAERILNRAIALVPKDPNLRVAHAAIELDRHADPHPLISMIEGIVAQDSREAPNLAGLWIFALLCERDFNDARRALAVLSVDGCYDDNVPFPRAWCEGVVAQMRGDKEAARAAFTSARTDAAKLIAEQPDYAEAHCVLGMADAALGNKEAAISEGRRAVELLPVTKDAMSGAMLVRNLAIIYAWTGEKDLAFEQLAIAAGLPGSFSYGQLKLLPFWDPLRGEPRFEKIVASLAPKER